MPTASVMRSCALAVAVGLASVPALTADVLAQGGAAWPSQNIMLVVPYPAGGPTDIIARIVAPHIAEQLGKPIVIENRAGASGSLGTASVARAAPDGHTLLVADPSMAVAPNVIAKLSFDPARDFTAVVQLVRSVMMLVVDQKLPVRSVAELVAMAKQKPGEIKYAHSGLGSPPHLGAMAFVEATGVDMLQVPYRGVGLALNDVVGGHISMVFVSQGVAAPHVTAGTARVLATMGGVRLKSLPEVPTFRELGIDLKVIDEGTWFGIVAPTGTPSSIVERLNTVANRTLSDPAVRQRFEAIDYTVVGGTAEDFSRTIGAHVAHWRTAFAKAGVKPQ